MRPISELDAADILSVPRTNLIGTMNCCQTVINGMNGQEIVEGTKGALYNFEGFGSDGTKTEGLSIYGASKFGLTYFTKALIKETKGGLVRVGFLSPGMVLIAPALLIQISIRSKAALAPAHNASTWAMSLTSQPKPLALAPPVAKACNSDAAFSAFAELRPHTTTLCPRALPG